jgi:enoyl-[acyl-carrier protein] reductase II
MFEGDMQEGELEIGQVAANFKEVKPAGTILKEMWEEFIKEKKKLQAISID